MKIAHKLFLSFLIFVLLIWVVGYLGIATGQEALKTQIGKSSASFAAKTLKDMGKDIHSKIELFQEYSNDLTLQRVVSEPNREFEKLDNIQAYIDQKDQEWTSASKETITPFMQKLMSNLLSEELIEKAEFYEKKHGHKVFDEIFVTNKYGANVAQTGKTTDYRQDDEQWWQKAKRDGVIAVDVEYDKSAGIYSTDIAIRIDDVNGNFIGVIKVVVNVEEVIETIKRAERGSEYKTVRFHLMNREGKAIYCKDYKFLEDLSDHLSLNKIDGDQGYFEEKGMGGDNGQSLFSYAILKGYKEFKGWGWILLIEYGTEEIFAPVTKLKNNIFLISLAVTTFAILMSLFIFRRISNPLTKLKNATITIGRGKLDTEIKMESSDEIGQLAGSFKKMVEDLAKTTTSIEYLNKEIVERERVEQALRRQANELRERVKELNCLYGISNLVEKPHILLGEIFQGVADIIPPSWQYPEITCARIILENQEYRTQNFRETVWKQTSDIVVHNQRIGTVEVYHLEEKPEIDEGPFIKEERQLINAIAKRLGHLYERIKGEDERKNIKAQLLQSEKMASVGQLAAGVAHEINNPTGFVSSNLKTLSEYLKDINGLLREYKKLIADLKENTDADGGHPAISEHVERITALEEEVDIDFILNDIFELIEESREGTERIKNIVQDLKDFAHPGEDKPKFADINKNLDSTVNVVWNELRYKADVTKDYGDLPQVHCYPQMINQVFVNILVNAAQSIKERGEIKIKTRADNGYAEIKISDTGSGIPKENLSKIFDPFFTTKTVGSGTGLGMNVAYNIIKKHNGTIDVESTVGAGTTFTIRLPVE